MGRQDARVVRVAAIGPSTGRGGGASETGEGSALWGREHSAAGAAGGPAD